MYADKLFNRVDQLVSHPNSGRVVPECNIEIIRELIKGNYRIVFKVIQDNISILRVHHAARLISPYLFSSPKKLH